MKILSHLHFIFDASPKNFRPSSARSLKVAILAFAALAASALTLRAGNIYVPNYSFELPVVAETLPFATNELVEWEETTQPEDYNPTNNYDTPWNDMVGTFVNVQYPGSYISNLDGVQAAFIEAYPGVGFFQDYNSIGGTNTQPDHAFNATFNVGKTYTLTVGLTGSTDEPLAQGTTLQLSLYYRDASSNMITIASNIVTYDTNVFTNLLLLTDFQVQITNVQAGDAWAGQHIGIEVLCNSSFTNAGGFWDIDNVRLVEGIYVPNYSFELPIVAEALPFATNELVEWEETPQPSDYNPTNNYDTPWDDMVGTFVNVPFPGEYISNVVGAQAAFLEAYPGVGFFQDYASIGGTNTQPDHAFNATFNVGKAYTLTVGLTGSTAEALEQGSTIQLSLYYRDPSSNIVIVGATTVTYDTNVFTNLLELTDFQVQVPNVLPSDPWAGQRIGIELLCTPSFDVAGGFWDADNVRLEETTALSPTSLTFVNGQAQFTVQGEPGSVAEILSTTNLNTPLAGWTPLGSITNVTGVASFTDPSPLEAQKFYTAQPSP
jgi:hypothetical protein